MFSSLFFVVFSPMKSIFDFGVLFFFFQFFWNYFFKYSFSIFKIRLYFPLSLDSRRQPDFPLPKLFVLFLGVQVWQPF